MKHILLLVFLPLFAVSQESQLLLPGEKHFSNLKQLTYGGDNAEAYFSFDGRSLVFQRTDHKQFPCDQIFVGEIPFDGEERFNYQLVSTGKGRTTCSWFMPGDSSVLYASTHGDADSCPPVPDRSVIKKYVWPIYDSYEIYVASLDGKVKNQLSFNEYYDAEATLSPSGDRIVFTSNRDGDLDLYTMNPDGSDVRRITTALGYDGGAVFSPDGKQIVWRASRPKTEAEVTEYRSLMEQRLVAPTHMALFIANADGTNARQITNLPGANWAPCWHPSGNKILFASNHEHPRGFPFNLYLINVDGTGLEKVSNGDTFDAFPMFSPDGRFLVFCSNRNNGGTHDTNIFIAEWKD